MKRLILAVALSTTTMVAMADEYVSPYLRQDGTYVEGYWRSSPNSTRLDNFGASGNVNPYTSQRGYVDPYPPAPAYTLPQNPYRSYKPRSR